MSAIALLALSIMLPERSIAQAAAAGPNRGGFTFVLSLGVGLQADEVFDETAVGLAGLNFGLGAFLAPDLALMFRGSGTTAEFDFGVLEDGITQTSGVAAIGLQYWASDRFYIESGPGIGFWTTEFGDDQGFGILIGGGFVFFQTSSIGLDVGLEFTPVFTSSMVQNAGLTFGFQLY